MKKINFNASINCLNKKTTEDYNKHMAESFSDYVKVLTTEEEIDIILAQLKEEIMKVKGDESKGIISIQAKIEYNLEHKCKECKNLIPVADFCSFNEMCVGCYYDNLENKEAEKMQEKIS